MCSRPDQPLELRRARPLLGTRVECGARGDDAGLLTAALRRALDEVAAVHHLCSFHDPASELSRLNREAWRCPQRVDRRTARALRWALSIARASGSAFDPTVAPRLVAAGFLPAPPGAPEPDSRARFDDVLVDGDRIRFRRPLWLDLGGVGKGYAVDRAVAALRAAGVRSGWVDAGGDLRVFGDRPHRVAVRDPATGARVVALIELANAALASSSACFTRRDSGTSHLFDPIRERFATAPGATVIAPTCALADGWTKGVLFAPRRAARALRRLGGAALLVDDLSPRWLVSPEVGEEAA